MIVWVVAMAIIGLQAKQVFSQDANLTDSSIIKVQYSTESPKLRLRMHQTMPINVTVSLNKLLLNMSANSSLDIVFGAETLAPQFRILELENNTSRFSKDSLISSDYKPTIRLNLIANYIGQAQLRPIRLVTYDKFNGSSMTTTRELKRNPDSILEVVIVQEEGIWGTVFIVSVTAFIILTYINLGAQLDAENVAQILKRPLILVLGFLIMGTVMPLAAWFTCQWLMPEQLIYRLGAFVFASGPTASASTLWTVMLDSDKELSVGLQIVSTAGSLISMPLLLYIMDVYFQSLGTRYLVKVPYAQLIQLLCVLLAALLIGWKFIAPNKEARRFSTRIFRPLTFFVLIYIIVFSSIVYWHIYAMFDWNITLAAAIISLTTYLTTGLLGYSIHRKLDHAITISISSAYKNSGVAFAVLLVTFDTPHVYIAYIPCLTQVVFTSLSLYLVYSAVTFIKFLRRRGQPDPIQAQQPEGNLSDGSRPIEDGSGRHDDQQVAKSDELIAMNVSDLDSVTPDGHKSD